MDFKDLVKKFPRLYFLARCIKNINNPIYHKLVSGYFDMQGNLLSLLIDNAPRLSEKQVLYDISFGTTSQTNMGFCALLYWTIMYIWFAEKVNFVPIVFWGPGCAYYDYGMDSISKNAFEYYFEPISSVDRETMNQNWATCRCDQRHVSHIGYSSDSYSDFNDNNIPIQSMIYKETIRLNSRTHRYIDDELSKIIKQGKVLGVHVRGTDFKKGFKNHPILVDFDNYMNRTRELFSTGKYEKIFLATDDIEALELFSKEFKDKLTIYTDVFRTSGDNSPHSTENNRPFHHYKLGLEVLRDVYTLANCDGLVCGLSNVSFAARYISQSLGRKYEDIAILNNGISEKNDKAAKKALKNMRKKQRPKKSEC